jgi:hypothetical protein
VHSPYRTAGVTEAHVCLEGREYNPVLLELFHTPSTHEAPPEIAVRRRLDKPRTLDRASSKNHCDRPPLSRPVLMLALLRLWLRVMVPARPFFKGKDMGALRYYDKRLC